MKSRFPYGPRLPARLTHPRARRWIGAGAAAVLVALVVFRAPLASWLWPDNPIDQLLAEGNRALADGRLDRADGTGARQKFEAALALDGDRAQAREGLAAVGRAALEQAAVAVERRQWERAHSALALAETLQVPRQDLAQAQAGLRRAEAAATDLQQLRRQVAVAMEADDPDVALPLLARWLALVPDDTPALEAREDALALLLQRADTALRGQDLAMAAHWIALVRRYDPGHVDLPAAQSALAQAVATMTSRVERELASGQVLAAATDVQVLRQAVPGDSQVAALGLRTQQALIARAAGLSADFQFDAAAQTLERARLLDPQAPAVHQALAELRDDRLEARARQLARTGRSGRTQVEPLLRELDLALERGDWISPPGASAYDRLRQAQAVAAEDPRVRAAAARLHAQAAICVDQALRGNRMIQAQECFEAWLAVAPRDPQLRLARTRLAQRWSAVAEERLRAGDLAATTRALGAARSLDPATPGLDDLEQRLGRARIGAR
jgi:hypothetical protein